MRAEHARLIEQLRAAASPPEKRARPGYHGEGDHAFLGVPVPAKRAIAKAWARSHAGWSAEDILALVESLFAGGSYEEKTLAPALLACSRGAREAVRPQDVERWLGGLQGWAEVDHLCQNLFPAEQLLAHWDAWGSLLRRLASAEPISRRRAALVLLVGPLRHSADPRLAELAFENLDRLKHERDPLIAKAASWLLRALLAHHAAAAAAYLDSNSQALAPVAVREARAKLATGVKSGRRAP